VTARPPGWRRAASKPIRGQSRNNQGTEPGASSGALLIALSGGAYGGGYITLKGRSRLPADRVIMEYGHVAEPGRRPGVEPAPAAERGEHWWPVATAIIVASRNLGHHMDAHR
jgi:hypothetical protein